MGYFTAWGQFGTPTSFLITTKKFIRIERNTQQMAPFSCQWAFEKLKIQLIGFVGMWLEGFGR